MANDFEKENERLEKQNEKLESRNRKLKKKNKAGGKIILFLLFIIAILAMLLFFLDPFGWGIGPNAKGGAGTAGTAPAQAAETTAAETNEAAETHAYLDITVSGATYLIGTEETTPDDLVKLVKDTGEDVIVNITDNNATQNAMEELTKRLNSENIKYAIK